MALRADGMTADGMTMARGKPRGRLDQQEPDRPVKGPEFTGRPESVGISFLSYMIGGMILYGGIGWLVGRWTHVAVLFPVGMLAGLALSVALIIFRVTRS